MAETNTTTPKAPVPASAPTQRTHQGAEVRDHGKAADLKKIETLQGEYDDLKAKSAQAAKEGRTDGVAMARKGDVTREIDALKRKHDLP